MVTIRLEFLVTGCGVQARYIILNGGNLFIGSKDKPYPGRGKITMWGVPKARELPGFGAKGIAVRSGNLTLHGNHKVPVWTQLALGHPVAVGSDMVIVDGLINWQPGDQIVIAPSSFDATHVDQLTIESVSLDSASNKSTIKTMEFAQFHHLAAVLDEYESQTGLKVDLRAEVAVLTRDVVVEGDPDSERFMFGAHIMMHSPPELGEEQSSMWIEQVEVRRAGQAFRLGRYPIHFHMCGARAGNYVKGSAIHHTYNRAVTMHGTNETLIQSNVAFDSLGHQFFVEDGSEAMNVYDGNLAMLARQSNALLAVDTTPANFWMTNPNNTVINNVAAGTTHGYGFWYRCDGDRVQDCRGS